MYQTLEENVQRWFRGMNQGRDLRSERLPVSQARAMHYAADDFRRVLQRTEPIVVAVRTRENERLVRFLIR